MLVWNNNNFVERAEMQTSAVPAIGVHVGDLPAGMHRAISHA